MNEQKSSSKWIEDGIDKIKTLGWCQRTFQNFDGNVCIRGSLYNDYIGISEDSIKAECYIAEAINSDFSTGECSVCANRACQHCAALTITGWNDHLGRTVDEVIDKMTEAAKAARNAGD